MDITYVSAYYTIYSEPNPLYLDYYKSFVERGYTCILYLDTSLPLWAEVLSVYKNVTIIQDTTYTDLPLVSLFPTSTKLPDCRSPSKDTLEYMILMNSKVQLIKNAAAIANTETLAWVDFGMMKLIRDPDSFFAKLNTLYIPSKIVIPGCVEKGVVSLDRVHWRFAGTLFFSSKKTISAFYELNKAFLEDLARKNVITWEVNVWAFLEHMNPSSIHWYMSDHNDRLVDFSITENQKYLDIYERYSLL